jgi:hypothetical protein
MKIFIDLADIINATAVTLNPGLIVGKAFDFVQRIPVSNN